MLFRRTLTSCSTNISLSKILIVSCLVISLCTLLLLGMRRVSSQISVEDLSGSLEAVFWSDHRNRRPFPTVKPQFPKVQELPLRGFERFVNEEARVVARPLKPISGKVTSVPKLIFLSTPYFSEWNPKHYYFVHLGSKTFKRYACPVHNCFATNEEARRKEADALLFHVRDLRVYKIMQEREPRQIWILYSMEPPWLEIVDMNRFEGVFNWTMSYRNGSDVLLSYGFVGQKPIRGTNESSELDDLMQSKQNMAVWFVSNCCTDSRREDYVRRLKQSYPVDVFGGCGMKSCRPAESKKCYSVVLKRYKFYLAFENALCGSYVTEKLYNALEENIVPVVLGGVNYSSITPHHSVINALDYPGPEALAAYLWQVSNDDTLYRSYFAWKDSFRAYLQPWMCDLCEKLHEGQNEPKSVTNLVEWWNDGNTCRMWTEEGLKPMSGHSFPCYHKKIF